MTIQIPTPEGVTAPKFQYFQRVYWHNGCRSLSGTIVGLEWIDDATALTENYAPGWWYRVSQVYGLTDIEQILSTDSTHAVLRESTLTEHNN